MLGGIDSEVVTKRATGLTPAMSSILMTHATESACVAVARQFAKTDSSRSLLSLVQESTLNSVKIKKPDKRSFRKKCTVPIARLAPKRSRRSMKFFFGVPHKCLGKNRLRLAV